jgi:hypothetical protein
MTIGIMVYCTVGGGLNRYWTMSQQDSERSSHLWAFLAGSGYGRQGLL